VKEDIEKKMLARKEELIARILESSSIESQSLASSMDGITNDALSALKIEKREALATRDQAMRQVKGKEKALRRLETDIKRKEANRKKRQQAAERKKRELIQKKLNKEYKKAERAARRVRQSWLTLLGAPLYFLAYFFVVKGWEHLFWEGIASTLTYTVGTAGIAAGSALYLVGILVVEPWDGDALIMTVLFGLIAALGFLLMGLGFALIWYDNSHEWAYWKSIWYYMTS